MTKLPANKSRGPRLGSLYTNWGGPGASGAKMSLMKGPYGGEAIHALAGGRYDLISWDPRGIGKTRPVVDCYKSPGAQKLALSNTVAERTFTIPAKADIWTDEGFAVLVEQQREAMALWEMQATICNESMGAEVLKYMGTTTLIKDLEYIKDTFDGKEADINFFGGSYGTIVGVCVYPSANISIDCS